MYRVKDTIRGESFVFLHSVPDLPLSKSITFGPRIRQVSQHVSKNKARYVCVTEDEDGTQTWRAGSGSGYCLIAAIEDWLATQEANQVAELVIIIPLDLRFYIATIKNGLVIEESVLVEARALGQLEDIANNNNILVLDTGTSICKKLTLVEPEHLSINLRAHRYGYVPFVFLRRKIPHPVLLLIPGVFIALYLITLAFVPTKEVIVEVMATAIQPAPAVKVSFNASTQLIALADALDFSFAGVLVPDKLKTIHLYPGQTLEAKGTLESYPLSAMKLSEQLEGQIELNISEWLLSVPKPITDDLRLPGEYSYFAVIKDIYGAASDAGARVVLDESFSKDGIRNTKAEIIVNRPSRAHLEIIATRIRNLPVSLEVGECHFSGRLADECRISLLIKTGAP